MAMVWSIERLKEVRDVKLLVNNIRSPASKLFRQMGIESVGVKNGKQPGRKERCRVMGMEIGT